MSLFGLSSLDSVPCVNICVFCSRDTAPLSTFETVLSDLMLQQSDFSAQDNYVIVNFRRIFSCPDCKFVPYSEVIPFE